MSDVKEILVLSGKGGTGKTSFAASLSVIAGSDVVVADCDVDASNMYLLLDADFKEKEEYYGGDIAIIDDDKCISCGRCVDVCHFDAIRVEDGHYIVDDSFCEGCGYCYEVCGAGAISMKPEKSGDLFVSDIRTGSSMVHAKLSAGGENSGKLVAQVKQKARKIAEDRGCRYVIADGAPGIGCPVASSLSGASVVLFVTEPSKSALHDLQRVLQVAMRFGVECCCVINKSDINIEEASKIRRFLDYSGVKYLGDIPYDISFVKAMSSARTIVELSPEIDLKMRDIWKELLSTIK
jgi:MinD superfamily P-loop ATPase